MSSQDYVVAELNSRNILQRVASSVIVCAHYHLIDLSFREEAREDNRSGALLHTTCIVQPPHLRGFLDVCVCDLCGIFLSETPYTCMILSN